MRIVKLRCDYMDNPVGFDFVRPVLNWVVEADGENRRQSAFRLQVSRDDGFRCVDFDTQKTVSNQSVGYRLEMPLEACTRYYWRVSVWDEADNESDFSSAAYFETARGGKDWQAHWIGYDKDFPQLRKGFRVEKPICRARAYASGVGMYYLFLNGAHVSDELFSPGFNAYDLWIQYQTYDITDMLVQGENVVAAWLGNGYYRGRVGWPNNPDRTCLYGDKLGFIMELNIEYADGTSETVLTDDSWEAMRSPYLRTEIYDGEVFDARLWDKNWCQKTGAVDHAQLVDIDKALLTARKSIPVKVMHTLQAVKKIRTPAGEQVFDFGQNIAGRIRAKLSLPKDAEVLFQFGEALDAKGNFYRENMRTALEEAKFISTGEPCEYAELFTYHGFRYVRVTGGELNAEDLIAESIYSAMETTGSFECSDVRVNRLFMNALWSQRSNFLDVPSDSAQRDERWGWTGDAQIFCPTACMNMESDAFYRKFLYDLKLEQKKMGYVPVVVPFFLRGAGIWEFPACGWSDSAVLMPWYLYLYYGDRVVLETQYESMRAWVDYITALDTKKEYLYNKGYHLGDWLAQDTRDPDGLFGMTSNALVATAYYAWSAEHVSKAAAVLGKGEDAREYADLAQKIREAFRREFVTETGRVAAETQTAYLLALRMNMLRKEQRPKAVECLAERLEIDHIQLTTGFLGTPILCPVLSDVGLDEYAYTLLLNNKCPSWLYEVEMGATTIWERWNSVRSDGSFGPDSMNSLNHYAFGAISEWLYRYVAGINPLENAPGFKEIYICPHVNDMLTHAYASIDTTHGFVESGWKIDGDILEIEIKIPFNTKARISLPDAEGASVELNGMAVDPIEIEAGRAVFECGSGAWRFMYRVNGRTVHKRIIQKEQMQVC